MGFRLYVLALVILSYGYSAWSACSTPTADAGAREYFTTPKVYRVCDGTNWVDFYTNGTMGVCAAGLNGTLEYDTGGTTFKYCNGTNWIKTQKIDCTFNGTSWALVGSLNNATYVDGPRGLAVSADNSRLFTASWGYVASWNKSSMPTIGSTVVHSVNSTHFQDMSGMVRSGNYLFIASQSQQSVLAVNVTNPAAMTYNTSHKTTPTAEMSGLSGIIADPGGTYIYTASYNSSGTKCWFHVINISTPTAPSIVGKVNVTATTGSQWCQSLVYGKGNYIYLSWAGGLATIDVSTKTAPVVRNFYDSVGTAQASAVSATTDGNKAYTFSQGGNTKFCVWDTSNPGAASLPAPTCYSSAGYEDIYASKLAGKYVIYTNQIANLVGAVNITGTPGIVDTETNATTLSGALELLFDGRYAMIGAGNGTRVTVLDMVCDPFDVVLSLGACTVAGSIEFLTTPKTLAWCNGTDWLPLAN